MPASSRPHSIPKSVLSWSLGYTVSILAAGMLGAALPMISADMEVSPAKAIWVLNAFGIAVTISILPAAALADSLGYKRVFLLGGALFACASAAAMLSPAYELLVAARFVQGLGAGLTTACLGHFVTATYPSDRIGRALATNAMLVSTASGGGPALAALILAFGDWRWIFAVTAVQSATSVVLSRRYLRPSTPNHHPLDVRSAVLNALAIGLLVVGFQGVSGGSQAWAVGLELVGAAVIGIVFVRRELAAPKPMLAVDLMRIPVVRLSVITMLISFGGFGMLAAALPFFLHEHGAGSPIRLGLLLAASPIGGVLVAPLAGRLSDRYPVGLIGGVGMALFGVGVLLIALASPSAGFWDLAWRILLSGVGFALFGPTNSRGMIMSAPPERTGAATGLNATLRGLAMTLGGAAAAVIFGVLAGGQATLVSTTAVLYITAGLAVLGSVLSLSRLRVS